MKRLIPLLALFPLLLACGLTAPTGEGTIRPPAEATVPPAPTGDGTARPPAEATAQAAPTPLPPAGPRTALPRPVEAFTLGEPSGACVGNGLAVDPDSGLVYTAGTRDEGSCLTAFDPQTGAIVERREIGFSVRRLAWDGETLYASGASDADEGIFLVADGRMGEVLMRYDLGQPFYNERVVIDAGWVSINLPGDPDLGDPGQLHVLPLGQGLPLVVSGARAFAWADDGRLAVATGLTATTVRVYAGPEGELLAERQVGPGQPGLSLAFAGAADRIFVARQVVGETYGEGADFVDVLDGTTLATVDTVEGLAWQLTADPAGERAYGRGSGGQIVAFDAGTGQWMAPVFSIPEGQPAGFTAVSPAEKLTIDPASGRVYVVYTDFDGQSWAAGFDPATGQGRADVQVPPGSWALDGGRLYFANADLLLALDGEHLAPGARWPLSRRPASLAVAPGENRLFVGDAGGDVHVVDLQTYAVLDRLEGAGSTVSVDPVHGWLYVGDRFTAGVSVFALPTLDWRGVIAQPGRPVASPADGTVYILEEEVYSGDGATLEVIEGRTARNAGCNGCSRPVDVVVDPRTGQTYVTSYTTRVGKPGASSYAAVDPTTGRAFVAHTTGGYRVNYTLAAYAGLDLEGEAPLAWRDGLYGQLLPNPATGQLYLASGGRLVVLEAESLDFLGGLYPTGGAIGLGGVNRDDGTVYLLSGEQVHVLAARGGELAQEPSRPVPALPGPVEGIVPMGGVIPGAGAGPGALFVRAYGEADYVSRLYRSTDGGQTWEEIRGGLPGAPNDLVVGPDGRLYAALVPAGWRGEAGERAWGEGMYVSTDGGDTWAPHSRGLAHLKVRRLHAGAGGQVHALATGTWPDQTSWLVDTVWQMEAGGRWRQVEVPGAGPYTSPDPNGPVPYTYTAAIETAWATITGRMDQVRSWGSEFQRSTDGGLTWETVGVGPSDYAIAVLQGSGDPPAVYWLTREAVYRSTDGGSQWAELSLPALEESELTTLAVASWAGQETLFVGTAGGKVWLLPMDSLTARAGSGAPGQRGRGPAPGTGGPGG